MRSAASSRGFTSQSMRNSPGGSGWPLSARSMSLRSVFCPSPSFQNDRIHIAGDEHRHLVVARTVKDELVEIFDGNGNVWRAVVESVTKRETIARVRESRQVAPPSLELIGPEGGWTDEELTAAGKNGFQPVSLGTALLKAETAAIIGAALIRYEFDSSGG